jgi:hypothetical protein
MHRLRYAILSSVQTALSLLLAIITLLVFALPSLTSAADVLRIHLLCEICWKKSSRMGSTLSQYGSTEE